MKKIFLLLFLFKIGCVVAQTAPLPEWKKYSWEEGRKPNVLTAEEKKKGAVIILDKRFTEIYFDETPKGEEANEYYTRHFIISLNSDNAIEEYNTVYIAMTGVTEVVDLQARFISKTGKIVTFDKKSVKDVENYNNHGPFKIFALEGIEKGGEVEYIYTTKRPFSSYGTETFRSSYDYREIAFDIYSPRHLKFDARSYNGLPDPRDDEDAVKKNVLHMDTTSIAGWEEEEYSSLDASYPRVEYKLAYNTSADRKKRLNTWNDAADAYYKAVSDATENEKRMCEALYKRMDINLLDGEGEKIQKIESYLKTHFTVRTDAAGDNFERISGILQTHLATEFGIMRLYWTVFDIAGVKKEVVLTSSRYEKQFDGDFDSWTFLQHFLMYFPNASAYIAPTEQMSRYGFSPAEFMSQDGLFIREVELGGIKSAIGTIKPIATPLWSNSISGIYANLTFDLEKGISNVHMKQTYTGYSGANLQPYWPYLSTEERRTTVNNILQNAAPDAKPKNIRVTGFNSDDTLYYQPFSIEADYSSHAFLEKTCDKYIFKIGELIGTQTEMYQSQTRRTDIEVAYPCGYHREIKFEVPPGYRVTNLDEITRDVHNDDTAHVRTMDFISSYKVEGRMVTVTIDESYHVTHFPKSMIEEYRSVVNASADFNKVTVYFEKDVQ